MTFSLPFIQDGQTYARIFMTLLSKVQDKEMLGYIVTLVDSLIKGMLVCPQG